MLKVEKLNKSYTNGVNTYPVLKDVSLHVKKGEVNKIAARWPAKAVA